MKLAVLLIYMDHCSYKGIGMQSELHRNVVYHSVELLLLVSSASYSLIPFNIKVINLLHYFVHF